MLFLTKSSQQRSIFDSASNLSPAYKMIYAPCTLRVMQKKVKMFRKSWENTLLKIYFL